MSLKLSRFVDADGSGIDVDNPTTLAAWKYTPTAEKDGDEASRIVDAARSESKLQASPADHRDAMKVCGEEWLGPVKTQLMRIRLAAKQQHTG